MVDGGVVDGGGGGSFGVAPDLGAAYTADGATAPAVATRITTAVAIAAAGAATRATRPWSITPRRIGSSTT